MKKAISLIIVLSMMLSALLIFSHGYTSADSQTAEMFEKAPTIDGVLDDAQWNKAAKFEFGTSDLKYYYASSHSGNSITGLGRKRMSEVSNPIGDSYIYVSITDSKLYIAGFIADTTVAYNAYSVDNYAIGSGAYKDQNSGWDSVGDFVSVEFRTEQAKNSMTWRQDPTDAEGGDHMMALTIYPFTTGNSVGARDLGYPCAATELWICGKRIPVTAVSKALENGYSFEAGFDLSTLSSLYRNEFPGRTFKGLSQFANGGKLYVSSLIGDGNGYTNYFVTTGNELDVGLEEGAESTSLAWYAYSLGLFGAESRNVTFAPHTHTLVHVDAKAATPTSVGWEAYDYCEECDYSTPYVEIPKLPAFIPGDINGDYAVNNKDLTRLFRYLSDWDVEVNTMALDTNGDGEINNKDLTRLFRYLSDWNVTLSETPYSPITDGILDDYMYVGGIKCGENYGLVKYDGNFYYVGSDAKIVKGGSFFVEFTNGVEFDNGVPVCAKYYDFNSDGTMVVNNEIDGTNHINSVSGKFYTGNYSSTNGSFAGVDNLGRVLSMDSTISNLSNGRQKEVGIFYFLWLGQNGVTWLSYDVTEVLKNDPTAYRSIDAWKAAGGGDYGLTHFWGKSLFGYYTTDDVWVMNKHVQMLTDAGIDYLIFDTTNGYEYANQALALMQILNAYYEQGYNVPKVAFYTNTNSGTTIMNIYNNIYKAHPEFSHLWYRWDNKPLIIGISSDSAITTEAKNFFRIKASQWPNDSKKSDGFPWIQFKNYLKDASIYGDNELLSISVAQHNVDSIMSYAAFYGSNSRLRSYDASGTFPFDPLLGGANIANQWDFAISKNVKNVFITGWNEWAAYNMNPTQLSLSTSKPIVLIDLCTDNASRDIEPQDGILGDNYYMQMIDGIRRFKGTADRVNIGGYANVTDYTDLSTYNNATAVYTDYVGDGLSRDGSLSQFGHYYSSDASKNDFKSVKVLRDQYFFYFNVETASNVINYRDANRMAIYLSTSDRTSAVNGYDYVINARASYTDGKAAVERWNGSSWELVGYCDYNVSGKNMVFKVDRTLVGMPGFVLEQYDLVHFEFKLADLGVTPDNVYTFYTTGEVAPYGRLNYVYSNKA